MTYRDNGVVFDDNSDDWNDDALHDYCQILAYLMTIYSKVGRNRHFTHNIYTFIYGS